LELLDSLMPRHDGGHRPETAQHGRRGPRTSELSKRLFQIARRVQFVARDEVLKVLAETNQSQTQLPSPAGGGMTTAAAVAGPIILLLIQSALQAGLPQAALGELIKKGLSLTLGDKSAEQPSLLPPSDSQPVSPSAESVV